MLLLNKRIMWLAVPSALAVALALMPTQEVQSGGLGTNTGNCAPPHYIEWPAKNPVWKMCWINPPASSGSVGSGLELMHVFYKNKRVFWQAHIPVLNVKYDNGTTYRDWANQLVRFEANGIKTPGLYAEPTVTPKTVCDHPGTDAGTFEGVAVERKADSLILTTQMAAGWYRYTQKWTFHLNGMIEPTFAFTAVENPNIHNPHDHHVYWRFDFDIDGFPDDVIEEYHPQNKTWTIVKTEKRFNRDPKHQVKWRVRDKKENIGYEVIPGIHDDSAPATAHNNWGGGDVWCLRNHPTELDAPGTGNSQHIDQYLNNENIDGQDVVLWYRAGYRHLVAGHCEAVGPILRPFGKW